MDQVKEIQVVLNDVKEPPWEDFHALVHSTFLFTGCEAEATFDENGNKLWRLTMRFSDLPESVKKLCFETGISNK